MIDFLFENWSSVLLALLILAFLRYIAENQSSKKKKEQVARLTLWLIFLTFTVLWALAWQAFHLFPFGERLLIDFETFLDYPTWVQLGGVYGFIAIYTGIILAGTKIKVNWK